MNTKINVLDVESIFIPRGSKIANYMLIQFRDSLAWVSMKDGNRWADIQIDVSKLPQPNPYVLVLGQHMTAEYLHLAIRDNEAIPIRVIDAILKDPWQYDGVIVSLKKKKPDVVEVVRYVRPLVYTDSQSELVIDNMQGVTLIILLNYVNKTIKFRYSICRGDNFNKEVGLSEAMKREYITIPMQGDGISRNGVVHDIVTYLSNDANITASLRELIKAYYNSKING